MSEKCYYCGGPIHGKSMLSCASDLKERLAAAEAANWRVFVPTPTADEPNRMLEMEVIAIDHKKHAITVSAYVHEAAKAEGGLDA